MPKRKRSQTQAVQQNRSDQGRGRGEGSDYKPWLLVHDVASQGRSSRLWANGRVNHTLSDWETAAFRDFQWDPEVTDIREQFPLDLDETRAIAAEIRVEHPFNRSDRAPVTMTTDFLVTRNGPNGPVVLARAIKDSSVYDTALARDERHVERMMHVVSKLEIERRYWDRRGVDWQVVTDLQLSKIRKVNIEFVLGVELDPHRPQGYWPRALRTVHAALSDGATCTLDEAARRLDVEGSALRRDFVACVRWLARRRVVAFDMDRIFDLDRPVSDFSVVASATGFGEEAA